MSPQWVARRMAVEGAVIVLSILLAFAIDAAWEARGDREARAALFDAYRSDIAGMRTELARVQGHHSRGVDAIRALMRLREGPALGAADAPRVDSILALALFGSSFDAPVGAARAIVAGGDLSFLRDSDVVSTTNQLLAHLESLEREQQEMMTELNVVTGILMRLGVDVADIWEFSAEDVTLEPWPQRSTEAWRVVTDVVVRSALSELYWQYNNTVGEFARVEGLLDSLEAAMAAGS